MNYEQRHNKNLAAYERKVDALYKEAVKEAAKIGVSLTDIFDASKPFSFDDYPITKRRLEKLLKELQSGVEAVIVNGVRSEWTLANNKNNELCNQVFGDRVLSNAERRRYYNNNDKALEAFEARKESGMNLSDRVWKYTNQFKEEIEMGLDLGIRSGRPALKMASDLKQYLLHPDKLFRRVRDEHGQLHLSKAAAAYHPGRGVYRSSYKNARRLAATETNIAYRTADYTRWQQLDFVVGIEVRLSNNHTCLGGDGKPHAFSDICDDLKGRYPKDFKFTGWHPHCRCHAVTILKTPEEMAADNKRIMEGKESEEASENAVTDVPEGFSQWIKRNEKRIAAAKQRGKLPYFLKDNEKYTSAQKEPQSILERATARHSARTPEQIAKIRDAWTQHRIKAYSERRDEFLNKLPNYDPNAPHAALDSRWNAVEAAIKRGESTREVSGRFSVFESRQEAIANAARTRHAARAPKSAADIRNERINIYYQQIDEILDDDTYGFTPSKALTERVSAVYKAINDGESLLNIQRGIQRVRDGVESANRGMIRQLNKKTNVRILTNYVSEDELASTLEAINQENVYKWRERGTKFTIAKETNAHNNGSTDMEGNIWLKSERLKKVKSAFGKIGRGESSHITQKETEYISTLWHEITHNRNRFGLQVLKNGTRDIVRRFELANEFVSRKSLDEFFHKLGVEKIPYPEFKTNRTNCGYNKMVRNYDYVIDKCGLNRERVEWTLRKYLFNENYGTMEDGLIKALKNGGMVDAKTGIAPNDNVMRKIIERVVDEAGKNESARFSILQTYLSKLNIKVL